MENVKCNLCGSSDYEILLDLSVYDDTYMTLINVNPKYNELRKCSYCELKYRSPQFTEEEALALYSGPYRNNILKSITAKEYFNKIISIPIDQSELYEKINWLKLKIENYPEPINQIKKMIDIGCGVGVFLFWFEKLMPGWMKYGVEPTLEFSRVASKETDAKILNSEFKPDTFDFKFDLVCLVQVIEHIPHPAQFMKSLKNILSTNGFLFIETPSDKNIKFLDPSHDVFMSPHLFLLSKVTMDILASKAHLKIVEYETVKNPRGVIMERSLLTVN